MRRERWLGGPAMKSSRTPGPASASSGRASMPGEAGDRSMKLERIIRMGVGELAGRGRQALSRRLDRLAWSRHDKDGARALWSALEEPPGSTEIRARARAGDASTAAH